MESLNTIEYFLDAVSMNLNNDTPIYKGGGSDSTKPYVRFEQFMDNALGYISYVYKNRMNNRKKFENSVANMNEECDCERYKCAEEEKEEEPDVVEEIEIPKPKIEEEQQKKEPNGSELLLKGDELV